MIKKKNKADKNNRFKWFIAILIFVAFLIVISTINNSTKTEFEICYEKCSRLGIEPGHDGQCDEKYHKRDNWCIRNGQESRCITECK